VVLVPTSRQHASSKVQASHPAASDVPSSDLTVIRPPSALRSLKKAPSAAPITSVAAPSKATASFPPTVEGPSIVVEDAVWPDDAAKAQANANTLAGRYS